MVIQYGLGYSAGLLSLLAPCVLPLIPIIFRSASSHNKWGPLANAMGLTFSFTVVGILTSLFSSIFDVDAIQKFGAILLIVAGLVFLFPKLKNLITDKLSFFSEAGGKLESRVQGKGFRSEFMVGSILGIIWGPCSGPTLAFAFGIATQADHALHASLIFFFFGLGAGSGLVVLGLVLSRFRGVLGTLMTYSKAINMFAGIVSIAIGILILTEQMPILEEATLGVLPSWLIQLSTSI